MNKEIIIIDIFSILKYAKKSSAAIATLNELIAHCSNEISIDEIDIDE